MEKEESWQDFLQGGVHNLYVKWQDLLMINAGQGCNTVVV